MVAGQRDPAILRPAPSDARGPSADAAACADGRDRAAGCASRPAVSARFDDLGADGAPRRLGIMGGTFDPIHIGHLAIAEQAREAMRLDAVVFIPTCIPVFKRDRAVTPAADRLEMCRLAVESNPFFDVSDIEIRRGGDTYTVDTLRQLRAHYPGNVELWFITGADAVASIVKWRESAAIAGLATLIAVTRPGFPLTRERRREIEAAGSFDVRYMEATALSVSSSDLRRRVAEGKSIRYLTMARVRDYIEARGLYRAMPGEACSAAAAPDGGARALQAAPAADAGAQPAGVRRAPCEREAEGGACGKEGA